MLKKLRISVPDMTCNHCKKAITEAIESLNFEKEVSVDLNNKTVVVESVESIDEEAVINAIKAAGYTPHIET